MIYLYCKTIASQCAIVLQYQWNRKSMNYSAKLLQVQKIQQNHSKSLYCSHNVWFAFFMFLNITMWIRSSIKHVLTKLCSFFLLLQKIVKCSYNSFALSPRCVKTIIPLWSIVYLTIYTPILSYIHTNRGWQQHISHINATFESQQKPISMDLNFTHSRRTSTEIK